MKKLKLTIELVPSSSFYHNIRAILSKKQWDILRKQVYAQAWSICQICGGVGKKHPVEAHEIWRYDDQKSIQKLDGMIALCPDCHMCKHMGLAQIQGKGNKALKHFMKVNNITKSEAEKYISAAFIKWAGRSSKHWKLDISILKNYGIIIKE